MLQVEISNRQDRLGCNARRIRQVLRRAFRGSGRGAELSVAVVGDEEITRLNRRFLGRGRPTDVMAFCYGTSEDHVEGEIVVNADQALRESKLAGHGAGDELLLYVVHGALHLLGYDDAGPQQRALMHARALEILAAAGRQLNPRSLLDAQPRQRPPARRGKARRGKGAGRSSFKSKIKNQKSKMV
jgi:probable rRNA maturation factor